MISSPAILKLKFDVNASLREELDFYSHTDDGWKICQSIDSVGDLVRYVEQSGEYRDLKQVAERLPSGRVLDVGVAYGITSAYLASKSFDVWALEPSL